MKQLTGKQKSKYINSGYCKCPKCKSENVTGDSIEIDCNCATQEVRCEDCGAAWRDSYMLSDVTMIE